MTLTRQITKNITAVIIDHDIVKSSLLESFENDIDFKYAGKVSYNIEWTLIDFLLSQGHNVILDSPCVYDIMIEKGEALVEKYKIKYKYIECFIKSSDIIDNRLQKRERMISQVPQDFYRNMTQESYESSLGINKKHLNSKCLLINTEEPIETYINNVLDYLYL